MRSVAARSACRSPVSAWRTFAVVPNRTMLARSPGRIVVMEVSSVSKTSLTVAWTFTTATSDGKVGAIVSAT